MSINAKQFGDTLKRGILLIRGHEGKSSEIVKQDLGKKLDVSYDTISNWCQGRNIQNIRPEYIIGLAREIVSRGDAPKEWAQQFFIAADYPSNDHNHKGWLTELFPSGETPLPAQPTPSETAQSLQAEVSFPAPEATEYPVAEVVSTPEKIEESDSFPPSSPPFTANDDNRSLWKRYWPGALAIIGLLLVASALLLRNNPAIQDPPIFADAFDDVQASSLKWKMEGVQHITVKDGRLWFEAPTNTSRDWYADVLEIRMENDAYFSRVEFNLQLDASPDTTNGYIGIQTNCDTGWMMVRIGDTEPAIFVEYSQTREGDEDFKGATIERLALINPGQIYNVAITWSQEEAKIVLDNQTSYTAPCLPSRYIGLFAGLPPNTSVRGFIDELQVWD